MSHGADEVHITAQELIPGSVLNPGLSPRRPSIEKPPILETSDFDDVSEDGDQSSAFNTLPEEIIQQILEAADPNAFASLILLNSKWRNTSQQGHLYATQLMRCPSYAASHKKKPDGKQENLPELRRLFAREVKRNLFEAYLRPNHTMIKIVSNSISSSSCPGGDGIAFSPSPMGHFLLAYNSSRIHIVDLRGPAISVERELKILRRPVATCIKDDGSLLAVLLTEMQVDLYDLTHSPPKHTQSFILDHSPRAIALSPCGNVLAAAYEGGIEVQALNPGALASDRRSVKCDAVDALAFSFDGTQILGTTMHSAQPNTVILTAPYYDPGAQISSDDISALWTTSILFPNTSRDCSHAVLLQESSHEEAYWAFTYDRSFETFRAVRIDDLRNGTTYFTGPTSNTPSKLLPCTLPSASCHGDLVSAGFQGKEVWLYGVPEDLEAIPDTSNATPDANAGLEGVVRSASGSSMRSRPRTQEVGEGRVPQWQLLCDKYRNTFRGGFKAAELSGVSTVKWVASFGDSSLKERLVIAAKGATPAKPISMDDDGMDFEDGGRLTLVDFDYGLEDGRVDEITIEVGMKEPEVLEEERRDLETEVAIVRRRTVAQRRGNQSAVLRAATTAAWPTTWGGSEDFDDDAEDDDPLLPRRTTAVPTRPRPASMINTETETQAVLEEVEALDAPYSHTGPRSITTLRRAATAAANHRRHHPTTSTGAPIEYRRADGRSEHPHESDADNWVPPPPPYQKEDPGEAPAFLRHSMVPVLAAAQPHQRNGEASAVPQIPPMPTSIPPLPPVSPVSQVHRSAPSRRAARSTPTPSQSRASRRQTQMPDRRQSTHDQVPAHRTVSSFPVVSTPQRSVEPAAPASSRYEEDDIYNVSPPDSPQPQSSTPPDRQSSETGERSRVHVRQLSQPSPALSIATTTTTYTGTQRVIPLVPRIQTTATSLPGDASHPSGSGQQQVLPEPSSASSTWNPHTTNTIFAAPVIESQTWPIPQPGSVAAARAALRYPRSAPPTSMTVDDMIARDQRPPLPTQEDSLSELVSGNESSLARRISKGFHVPRMHTTKRSQSRTGERSRPLSITEQPPRPDTTQAMYQHQQYPPRPGSAHTSHRAQPQQLHAPPVLQNSSSYHGTHTVEHAQSEPDQPLIISTPTGVHGAYDPPAGQPQDPRAQTCIVAPVPRHPRLAQDPALGRPTGPAQRLENSYHGQLSPNYSVAPAVDSSDFSARLSSLNRRPSRAERSAAKNIADAKKKGWRPGRSKSQKGKKTKPRAPEFDMMSQSAWTDVTASTAFRPSRRGHNFPHTQMPAKVEKDKKCVVM
ncbi:hypothetical protein N0V93_001375 [Gnomoniopsis smithogilvyi]|uniref:F-box domain-containing protein n=1 Tax=Gnomoniopsis smithogilvyi TaxID=1191159 RepID=A0A9W8Z1H8_9PEZI|nr:hypothetical protein N0V93_001375 [Gnomoniopsis smithogilvyi]